MILGVRDDAVRVLAAVDTRVLGLGGTVPKASRLVKATLPVDGVGLAADGLCRAAVYSASALVAESEAVVIAKDQASQWVDFSFLGSDDAGVLVAAGTVLALHLHVGADVYVGAVASPVASVADVYAGGAAATPGGTATNSIAGILTLVPVYAPLSTVTEQTIARMAFPEAQAALGATSPSGTAVQATCGWHGTSLDRNRGSFAVVREDGPLAGLVGQRVLIRASSATASPQAYAYVVAASGLVVEDISVSRRLFLALGALASDEIAVDVAVLAPAVVS